eukprot:2898801-Prymnesium_polylepis.2
MTHASSLGEEAAPHTAHPSTRAFAAPAVPCQPNAAPRAPPAVRAPPAPTHDACAWQLRGGGRASARGRAARTARFAGGERRLPAVQGRREVARRSDCGCVAV